MRSFNLLAYIGLGLLAPALHADETARVLAVQGPVTIDGVAATAMAEIKPGARVETSAGQVVIASGEDNVVKLAPESRLRLETVKDGRLTTVLEKGRLDGVIKLGGVRGSARSAKVGTRAGTLEIAGGRYQVEVSGEANGTVRFDAVDGGARVTSGGRGIELNDNQRVLLGAGAARGVASLAAETSVIPARDLASATTSIGEVPRLPRDVGGASGVTPTRPPGPIFSSTTQPSSLLNRDPLQALRQPRVNVIFNY